MTQAAHAHVDAGPPRHGARAVAAGGPRRISLRASSVPIAPSRACCTIRAATAAPPREFFTSPKAACRFPTTKSACRKRSSAKCSRLALEPAARHHAPAVHRHAAEAGGMLCFAVASARSFAPKCPASLEQKTMEIRFFAPGNLVSNLDFVETIFGNAGDPILPENDAALDAEHWTGHTGCVILAPHLIKVTKKDVGLPHWDQATERQRRDGMCWKNESELYNNGGAFKLTCRDEPGVIVTLIADNYFGYCKKEVKTQISYAANLYGLCEEEHAGGALVYPALRSGRGIQRRRPRQTQGPHLRGSHAACYGKLMDIAAGGLRDRQKISATSFTSRTTRTSICTRKPSPGPRAARSRRIKLLPDKIYVRPSGYKVRMEKPGPNRALAARRRPSAEGTLCHKPCTVSGGGKSEISKPITDAILTGPVFVADFKKDFDQVAELIDRDYSDRFTEPGEDRRPPHPRRGTLARLRHQTAHARRTRLHAEYNAWLESVPQYLKELVFVVKRYYKPSWDGNWREHFSVDIINGTPAQRIEVRQPQARHHLFARRLRRRRLLAHVRPAQGFSSRGENPNRGRHHRLGRRAAGASLGAARTPNSLKFVHNCESRLFQRPDDAIHRGYDKADRGRFRAPGQFLFQLRAAALATSRAKWSRTPSAFTNSPSRCSTLIQDVMANGSTGYFVCSANPRLVDGKPTKNPRYLQIRPDLLNPRRDVSRGNGHALAAAACRRKSPFTLPSPPCCPAAATIRPSPASARSRSTIRSTTWSCRNCSWNSFAA